MMMWYVQLYSMYDKWKSLRTLACSSYSRNEYSKLACSTCGWPNEAHQIAPTPLRLTLSGDFRGSTKFIGEPPVSVVSSGLRERLGEFLPSAVWGACDVDDDCDQVRYFTVQAPRNDLVSSQRGRGCTHSICDECQKVRDLRVGKERLIRGAVNGRRAVVDDCGSIYIDPELVAHLRLREDFADLRYWRIPIRDRPEYGWVLPGDPMWSGRRITPSE
jgi:hypothetical protein